MNSMVYYLFRERFATPVHKLCSLSGVKTRAVSRIVLGLGLFWAGACRSVQRPDGGSGLLPVGSVVPALVSQDQLDRPVALKSTQVSVVYFYPRDGTPGCTKEACAFRDVWKRFEAANVRVIGVSMNSAQDHREFAQKHQLAFSLISDSQREWSQAFGVPGTLGMLKRVSFLLDGQGLVAKVYSDVDPGVHADEVLRDAARLAPHENNQPVRARTGSGM
jgi:thioredoxin-dependent peroxiredoxin